MKEARAEDYWEKVYSSPLRYSNYVREITFEECNGLSDTIKFEPGITVFCGLNGAGKSSIIASVKELLGLAEDSVVCKGKFSGNYYGKIVIDRNEVDVTAASTAVENGLDADFVKYIDGDQSIACLKYWEQTNLDELIDSEEEYEFDENQLEELNYLTGKSYTKCLSYEISDDISGFTPVFFKVFDQDNSYDSTGMGLGEHFIIYFYYLLQSIRDNTILIIEEPETFISVMSQKYIINQLAKIIAQKKISVILSTHSPHLINSVNECSIRIVTNYLGKIMIFPPHQKEQAKTVLGEEYVKLEKVINCESKAATVFVEDYAARVFLNCILRKDAAHIHNCVDVVSVNGESAISGRLMFDDSEFMTHRFIGVYDGDMIGNLNAEKIKWPYVFLPVEKCVETEMKGFFSNPENINDFCTALGVDYSWFVPVLSKHRGEDHHDWLLNIAKDIGKSIDDVIEAFYIAWKNDEVISNFIHEINQAVFGE